MKRTEPSPKAAVNPPECEPPKRTDQKVEDAANNTTRFVLLAKDPLDPAVHRPRHPRVLDDPAGDVDLHAELAADDSVRAAYLGGDV